MELEITCVHDFMVVTVTVTKIYGKMNFTRWTIAITAIPTTLTLTISDNWVRTSAVIHVYKVRARRNRYRMFISVYIPCLDYEENRLHADNLRFLFPRWRVHSLVNQRVTDSSNISLSVNLRPLALVYG